MKSVVSLQQDRAHKQRCAQDLIDRAEKENRTMDADESQLFDTTTEEIEAINVQITEIEAHVARSEKLAGMKAALGEVPGRRSTPDTPATTTPQAKVYAEPFKRSGRLKAFAGPNAEERAYRAGMWARAMLLNDNRAGLWCENHFAGFRNALGENNNSAGGILVPEELSQTIIDLREQYGVFRQQAFVYPMGSDTAIVPRRVGGVTVEFVGENPAAGPTESTPAWNSIRLTAKKAAGLCRMSTEVSEDAIIDLAEWIAQEVAYAFALKEDQCGWTGDGTSTYGGINGLGNILVAGTLISAVDAVSGHDLFTEVDATDLTKVMSVLPAYARMNAKWYVSTVAMDLVFGRLMLAAGGNNMTDVSQGYSPRYMGYPIVISQVLPTSTSAINDVPMLYFGDLRMSSTMGTRREVRVVPSAHRYIELDQLAFYFTERFDIVNHDYGNTVVAGPIVGLIGNT